MKSITSPDAWGRKPIGPKKRIFGRFHSRHISASEWTAALGKPGHEGGMSAQPIQSLEAELQDIEADLEEPGPLPENASELTREDIEGLRWYFKTQMKRRRASPPWS